MTGLPEIRSAKARISLSIHIGTSIFLLLWSLPDERRVELTICIAAIAEKKYVVMAADRTLTLSLEPPEYGHEHASKLYELTPSFIVGAAGSPVFIPELFRRVDTKKAGKPDFVYELADALTAVRKVKIEQEILRKIGWTYEMYEEYYSEGKLLEAHARKLLEEMTNYHACIHLVTGNVLPDAGATIHMVEDPGSVNCFDAIGFIGIGSGESYAVQNLIRANYTADTPLLEAIYQVFEAKKNAEQAVGVGRRTDIRIIMDEKKNIQLSDNEVLELNDIYDTKMKRQEKTNKEVLGKVEEWLPDRLEV